MKKLHYVFATIQLLSANFSFAQEMDCSYTSSGVKLKTVIECDTPSRARINTFRPIGWVTEESLVDAKLCIYKDTLRGNPAKARLLSTYQTEDNREITYVDEYDYTVEGSLTDSKMAKLLVTARSEQKLDSDDKLIVRLGDGKRNANYFFGMNSYLSIGGFKYKAYIDINFNHCELVK